MSGVVYILLSVVTSLGVEAGAGSGTLRHTVHVNCGHGHPSEQKSQTLRGDIPVCANVKSYRARGFREEEEEEEEIYAC